MGHHVEVVALHNEGLLEHEEMDGSPVHRIALTSRGWPKIKIIQLLKYVEFIVRFKARYGKESFLHCNDMSALLVGVICMAFHWKLQLVYDSHEYAINRIPNESKFSIRLKYALEKILLRFPRH